MNLSDHLYIFNHIISNGEKKAGKFHLNALSAWHDLDGYTCYIGYKELILSFYFHGRFSYDYTQDDTFKEFDSLINNSISELKVS